MRYTFPTTYGEECIIIALDKSLVPLVGGALRIFEQSYSWKTDQDYEQGYNAFAELQAQMVNNCLLELVESNNRIYRLLDNALNGTQYTATDTGPGGATEVFPPIADVPPAVQPINANAVRANLRRVQLLLENAVGGSPIAVNGGQEGTPALPLDRSIAQVLIDLQGITGAGWFGLGGRPATLADLLQAGRINTPADQGVINNAIEEVLNAAGNTSGIATALSNILAGAADVATDGGVVATLIAASIANSAIAGATAAQLDRIIKALDGGGPADPSTNVLAELDRVGDAL